MKSITILIPAYNEELVLMRFYKRLNQATHTISNYHFEYLFINDGSKDRTLTLLKELRAKDPRVNIIDLSRNFGKEIAMIAGLDYSRGDAVIIIDADLQDPPELIPEMIRYWEKGYDDVFAKRISRQGESFLKKFTSKRFYKLLNKITHIPIQEDTGDFRLLDQRCVEALKMFRETQRYTKGMFSWIGYNKKEIGFERSPRAAGKTKWNYFKLINLAIEGITSFTTAPLRISSIIGAFVSLCAFIFMIWVFVKALVGGTDVSGYPSLMVVILFLGGIQLLSLGIIGEYLGRVFNETKNRPLYFIDEYNGEKIKNKMKGEKMMKENAESNVSKN